jgi:uncharacterized protein YndB with AHSA1/START domain
MNTTTHTSDRVITLGRTFAAPRELVWRAYTEPEHFARWFGPNGFTVTMDHMDVREGGSTKFVMHGPDGTDYPNFMSYTEVIPVERLAFDHGASREDPRHFEVVIKFVETPAGTELTSTMTFPTVEDCDHVKGFGAVELGQQTLAKLADYLKVM